MLVFIFSVYLMLERHGVSRYPCVSLWTDSWCFRTCILEKNSYSFFGLCIIFIFSLAMQLLVMDFETTGLNHRHDQPVQLALLHYDCRTGQGRVRSSYISSDRAMGAVAHHITTIDQSVLATAPRMTSIIPAIQEFLEPIKDPLILGHNIAFDWTWWQTFVGIPLPDHRVDTYDCATLTLPHQTSYALDQLSMVLDRDPVYGLIRDTVAMQCGIDVDRHHDAATDCLRTLVLALWARDTVAHCFASYSSFLAGVVWLRDRPPIARFLLPSLDDHRSSSTIRDAFPRLETPLPSTRRTLTSSSIPSPSSVPKFFSPSWSLVDTLAALLACRGDRPLCLACAHTPKLTVIYDFLRSLTDCSIWWLNPDQRIDSEQWNQWTETVDRWTWDEWAWCIKRCIHHRLWRKVFDARTPSEKRILAFLNRPSLSSHAVILASHHDVYARVHTLDPRMMIVFLDADWWYSSFNSFRKRTLDMYQIGQVIEDAVWLLRMMDHPGFVTWQWLVQDWWVMVGQWNHMRSRRVSSYPHDQPILHRRSLQRDDHALAHCDRCFAELAALCADLASCPWGDEYGHRLWLIKRQWDESDTLAMMVVPHHSPTDDLWYTLEYHPRFSDFSELESHLRKNNHLIDSGDGQPHRVVYCSLTKANQPWPWSWSWTVPSLPVLSFSRLEQLCQHTPRVFILSVDKAQSQRLWNQLRSLSCIHSLCEAENISCGHKKIISLARNEKQWIMIGGYSCLLALYGEGVMPYVIEWYVSGPLAQTVRAEVHWFGSVFPHESVWW